MPPLQGQRCKVPFGIVASYLGVVAGIEVSRLSLKKF